MAQEALVSVISPETKRQKLGPKERPPEFGGRPAFFRPYPGSITLAERLETLENKTLYLVDIGFGGGYNFMIQIQRWFAEHMPSVKTIPRRKPGFVFADDDNALWDEIKEEGDAVVIGVGG